jgi:hypothetical protein
MDCGFYGNSANGGMCSQCAQSHNARREITWDNPRQSGKDAAKAVLKLKTEPEEERACLASNFQVEEQYNFIQFSNYRKIALKGDEKNRPLKWLLQFGAKKCDEQGKIGFFYQKQQNGHEIMGFYGTLADMHGRKVHHGHDRGFIATRRTLSLGRTMASAVQGQSSSLEGYCNQTPPFDQLQCASHSQCARSRNGLATTNVSVKKLKLPGIETDDQLEHKVRAGAEAVRLLPSAGAEDSPVIHTDGLYLNIILDDDTAPTFTTDDYPVLESCTRRCSDLESPRDKPNWNNTTMREVAVGKLETKTREVALDLLSLRSKEPLPVQSAQDDQLHHAVRARAEETRRLRSSKAEGDDNSSIYPVASPAPAPPVETKKNLLNFLTFGLLGVDDDSKPPSTMQKSLSGGFHKKKSFMGTLFRGDKEKEVAAPPGAVEELELRQFTPKQKLLVSNHVAGNSLDQWITDNNCAHYRWIADCN